MSKPLPYGDYRWEDPSTFETTKIMQIPHNSERGFLFEIDGHFPTELHDYLNDYVPLPENKAHTPSPYMQQVAIQIGTKAKEETHQFTHS